MGNKEIGVILISRRSKDVGQMIMVILRMKSPHAGDLQSPSLFVVNKFNKNNSTMASVNFIADVSAIFKTTKMGIFRPRHNASSLSFCGWLPAVLPRKIATMEV